MDEGLIAACGMNVAICSGYIAYQHDVKSIVKQVDLNAGIHPKIVSERLAHSNIGITLDTYSHVLPGLQEAAAERFDKILDEKVNSRVYLPCGISFTMTPPSFCGVRLSCF